MGYTLVLITTNITCLSNTCIAVNYAPHILKQTIKQECMMAVNHQLACHNSPAQLASSTHASSTHATGATQLGIGNMYNT
jgi:hypothetical protein